MSKLIGWAYSSQSRTEVLFAGLRLLLVSITFGALWFNSAALSSNKDLASWLMAGYTLYSLAIVLIAWRVSYSLKLFGRLTLAVDLVMFAFVMFLTATPGNPFFACFIFAMICSTIRGHKSGALYASIIVFAVYLGFGFFEVVKGDPQFELNLLFTYCIYIAVVASMLIYIGASLQRKESQVNLLAQWPVGDFDNFHTFMLNTLRQACLIMDFSRALAIWYEPEEPWVNVACFSKEDFKLTQEAPKEFGGISSEPIFDQDFLCFDAAKSAIMALHDFSGGLISHKEHSPFDPVFLERFKIGPALSLRLSGERVSGRLMMLDKSNMSTEDLVMGRIVANRVSTKMDQHYLIQERCQGAIFEERSRLARDLHDGLLQSLAGIGIKMQAFDLLFEKDPDAARKDLFQIMELLSGEQRDLRYLIRDLKSTGSDGSTLTSFQARLSNLAALIYNYWGLKVELKISDPCRAFSPLFEREIYFLLRESLVNCAKHASASKAMVQMDLKDEQLHLVISDDGEGFPFSGRYDFPSLCSMHIGPETIKQRVAAFGGDLTLDSSSSGTRLKMMLPLQAKGD